MYKYLDLRGTSWEEYLDDLQYVVDDWYLRSSCIAVGFRIIKLTKNDTKI